MSYFFRSVRTPRLTGLLAALPTLLFSSTLTHANTEAAVISHVNQPNAIQGITHWAAGNYQSAIQSWQLLAQNGDTDAQFNLGQAYKLGQGTPVDLVQAEAYFQQAALGGHHKAADYYGIMLFQRGEQAKAIPFIEASALRGDARAQYILALAYFNGDVVAKNWARAYALISLAEENGLTQATEAKLKMEEHIPLQDRRSSTQMGVLMSNQANSTKRFIPASSRPVDPETGTTNLATAPEPASHPGVALTNAPAWKLLLGSFRSTDNAQALIYTLQQKAEIASHPLTLVHTNGWTSVQASGFASKIDAVKTCSTLKSDGVECLVINP